MSKLYYICKYTPVELLFACGADCAELSGTVGSFSAAETVGHPNLCGFGKAILEKVLNEGIKELVLVNCCDTIRSVYDILLDRGGMDFLYFMDLVHDESECGVRRMAYELKKLYRAYRAFSGNEFSPALFAAAFSENEAAKEDYAAVLGARVNTELSEMIEGFLPLPVKNLTCVSGRDVRLPEALSGLSDEDAFFTAYAKALIAQTPCMRMNDITARKKIYNDPHLKAIVYHTIKFCDYYGFEYSELSGHADVPLLKIETDCTVGSAGQLSTRLEAFAEQLALQDGNGETKGGYASGKEEAMNGRYFAGIDSGSTSTKAVVIDGSGAILGSAILPTGAKVSVSGAEALDAAIRAAGISRDDLANIVTTGYGRKTITHGGAQAVTEISCHARGAHALNKDVRTIIDIGGQDSKVISVDDNGNVISFAMNDKCAAGTGRFLEMTGRALGLSLAELSGRGLTWKEDISISNTCTVFAESEIISLVAGDKSLDDIVHGLNKSVGVKIASLMKRTGARPVYMMTGGVAANRSVIRALEEMLGERIVTSPYAQLCGAYGAALYAKG